MKDNNVILDKSFDFSIKIVDLYKDMVENKKEFVLSKQILRAATSIGANVHEAMRAYSKRDFLYKCTISFKEAGETEYWLKLLYTCKYINKEDYNKLMRMCREILRILNSIILSTKRFLNYKDEYTVKRDYTLNEVTERELDN